jgi:hypothetical protein
MFKILCPSQHSRSHSISTEQRLTALPAAEPTWSKLVVIFFLQEEMLLLPYDSKYIPHD